MNKIPEKARFLQFSGRGRDHRLLQYSNTSRPFQFWYFQPLWMLDNISSNAHGSLLYGAFTESILLWEWGRRIGAGKNKDHCPSSKLILRQQNTYKSAWIKKQSGGSYGTSDLFKWSIGVLRVSAQPIKLRKHSHQMAVWVLCETGVWQSGCHFFFFLFFFLAPFAVGPGL